MLITSRVIAVALAAPLALLGGCWKLEPNRPADQERTTARERALARQLQAACSSQATYDRLKQVAFDDAIKIRNADPENLDTLATYSVVRMENPRVKSRDEALDVTVCSGRFVLELPPGAERGFGGERRLVADIEYAAQAAADGSGLVYQVKGAEPIVYKLAAFDLKRAAYRPPAAVEETEVAVAEEAPAPARVPAPMPTAERAREARQPAPEPAPARAPQPRATRTSQPPPRPAPPAPRATSAPRRAATASPSFNCRNARTRSERMVCGSGRLASLDRAMSSQYYSALSVADKQTRSELRRTRDRFLGYRERCSDEACVAQAYRDRMDEIDDIAGER